MKMTTGPGVGEERKLTVRYLIPETPQASPEEWP